MVLVAVLSLVLVLQNPVENTPSQVAVRRSIAEWTEIISRLEPRDPASREYVPGLIDLMNDPGTPWVVRRQAALTLGRMGPLAREAIPSLVQQLDDAHDPTADPELGTKRWALAALGLFGREARAVAPRLIELLQDEHSSLITRLGCLEALSQIGSAAPDGIAAIWRELDRGLLPDASPDDRQSALGAAEALGAIGPDAAAAVPILLHAVESEEPAFRQESIRSLGRIGPRARDAGDTLAVVLISDPEPSIRNLAAASLGQLGPDNWPLVEPLLLDDEAETRARSAGVVAEWKTLQADILPVLEPLLEDSEASVRVAACRSWRRLTGRHDRVWPILIELLTDTDRSIRRDSSRELQSIAQESDVTDAELARLLESPDQFVRREGAKLQRMRSERRR